MLFLLGYFYIFLGLVFLFIPLIYLEVGRPRDFIKAGLSLLVGLTLIIKNKLIENLSLSIYLLITILVFLYQLEIFSYRWNQLTDKEKKRLKTLLEFKKNFLKIFEALNLAVANLKDSMQYLVFFRNNKNINKKKWVRNDKNDNIKA